MRLHWKPILLSVLISGVTVPLSAATPTRIDLAGPWLVRLDRTGRYQVPASAAASTDGYRPVRLPGALRDSGLGDPVGPQTHWIGSCRPQLLQRPVYKKYQAPAHFKIPFWLQPERHYVGPAYYCRTIEIPASWQDQRVLLVLERPHWQTHVWVDGKSAGQDDSLSTAHVHDLTKLATPGRHQLIIRVDNSLATIDVGLNSHSVSDHTQTAWNGIVGKIELRAEPRVCIDNIQIVPADDARSAQVTLRVVNLTGARQPAVVKLRARQDERILGQGSFTITAAPGDSTAVLTLPFDRAAGRWDEFQPRLGQLTVTLSSARCGNVTKHARFGVRDIKTVGTQFVLNGRKLFLRGTLECCIFPLTGYPPTAVEPWKRIIRVCKAHGLNLIRFHSWCPPEAAFVAADELGFYYQVECSTWPNNSTGLGLGKPIDKWLYREGARVLAAYGNHPSFLLLSMGNEPGGPQHGATYLGPWVDYFKQQTDRQLVTAGSGWPSIAQNEFHVTPQPRIQHWGQGLGSRINAQPPATVADYRDFVKKHDVPVISHEIGQWCVYPNFDEMKKYVGALKPRNFEIFRELLDRAHMLDQAHDFLMASGKLQSLCYKEEIESALRTPGFGGFELLDLHDFPGQGTALVGVLDPFWDSKPYLTPGEFRRFCGPTVPLARLAKRCWTSNETFAAEVEVAHFGPVSMPAATPHWRVSRGREVLQAAVLPTVAVPTGKLTRLGRIEMPLADIVAPVKLTLQVAIENHDDEFINAWDFWVFPAHVDTPPADKVLLVHRLDNAAETQLKHGGRVVLLAEPNRVRSDVRIGFSSIFWNTAWTDGQPPQTLGILCDPKHAAFAAFPTDYHSDWQWWSIIHGSVPMVLDALPTALRPLVQVVPDWFHPQRLGLAFEAQIGPGKLLVCSADLEHDLDRRPAARQLRHSLMQYAASDQFQPPVRLDIAAVRALFREPPVVQRIGAKIRADNSHPDYEAMNAIDGDPRTIWHSNWGPPPSPLPHALILDLGKPRPVVGLRYLPRQDMTNGRIAEYSIQVSSNGKDWGDPVASGTFPRGAVAQIVRFAKTYNVRFVKLNAKREVRGRPYAAVAELDVLLATASD